MSVNQLNYNGEVKFADDYLAKAQSVPQNTSADGNGGVFENLGQAQGSIEVVAKVNAEIGLADTKVVTVKLQHSDDNSSFTDLATLYTKTASGAETIPAGTELARYIVPTNAKRYIKAVLTTTDAAGTGKVDIYTVYLAR
ncbi:MAG: hypothetical protein RDU14_17550 [Melioribacteraceae bacterium]|nr:hypothetical protein [Melioribacteraceae bacterium]